jgi:pimeloyl-ACP methyl ester carboxylesterase
MLAGGAGMAALAAVNASIRRQAAEPDDSALGGEPGVFEWRHGNIIYRMAGVENSDAPVVFVHSIGPGLSSFMWRKNFDALAESFRVYAPDLIGFGLSDKPANISYAADLYVELLADFVRDVCGNSAHLIASSLGAAYCARLADEHPELVESLILVSPTGADNLRARPGMTGAAFYGLMNSPVLGTSFYNVVASERSIRDYARDQLFFNADRVTERLVAHHYSTSHLPGAQYAIAAFLSGYLNTDIREAFARIEQPVTLVWGKQDTANPIHQAADLFQSNPNATLQIFDRCRLTPPEEYPDQFNSLVRKALGARANAAS